MLMNVKIKVSLSLRSFRVIRLPPFDYLVMLIISVTAPA